MQHWAQFLFVCRPVAYHIFLLALPILHGVLEVLDTTAEKRTARLRVDDTLSSLCFSFLLFSFGIVSFSSHLTKPIADNDWTDYTQSKNREDLTPELEWPGFLLDKNERTFPDTELLYLPTTGDY